MGSTSIAGVVASGVLVAASGVVCDSSLFSLEIAVSKKLLTSDGAGTKSSVSLIEQVALVRQQHEAFGLQGRVVDVAHVGQAHPCYKSRTAEYPHRQTQSPPVVLQNAVREAIVNLIVIWDRHHMTWDSKYETTRYQNKRHYRATYAMH